MSQLFDLLLSCSSQYSDDNAHLVCLDTVGVNCVVCARHQVASIQRAAMLLCELMASVRRIYRDCI